MTTLTLAVPEDELSKVLDYLRENQREMTKLLVEVASRCMGNSITKETCSKIYDLYLQLHRTHPGVNVQINVETLKGRPAERRPSEEIIELSDVPKKLKCSAEENVGGYKNVVLGGTFDRLHVGHKILLTEAVIRCQSKLTVGVTDESMIKGKKMWELIEPVEKRMDSVLEFLEAIDGGLVYDVVSIADMFGPTITDPNLDLIVVTTETLKGGQKVNEVRQSKQMSALAVHVVHLVESENLKEGDEQKVSSSNQRLRLLGTRLRQPDIRKRTEPGPYIIGLTGGIASGKSSIGRRIEKCGAGLIDCDVIGHQLYRKGTPTYHSVIELFGQCVIAEDGEINRRALGNIVFSSQVEMKKLNDLMWPSILEASLAEALRLHSEERKKVVVLEAAVLLRAGWASEVDEVWASIIPPDEAAIRLMNRNQLTEEEARTRIAAQPSNTEYVSIANVVFSTLLSPDFTQSQVEKAWEALQTYLSEAESKL